jgi:MFS family permease
MSLFAIQLGAGAFEIGLLIAMSLVFQLVLGIYAGKVSDRYGFRLPILFGSLGSALAMLVPWLYPDLTGLYASRALTGLSFIFFSRLRIGNRAASMDAWVESAQPEHQFTLWRIDLGMIAPLLVGSRSITSATRAPISSWRAWRYCRCSRFFTFPPDRSRDAGRKPQAGQSNVLELMRIAPLRRTLLAGAIVFSGTDLLSFYVPIYGTSIGLSASTIGVILGAYAAAQFVVRAIMPALVRRWGEEKLLTLSLLAARRLSPVSVLSESVGSYAIAFALGLGLGCGQPLSMMLTYPTGRPTGARGKFWDCASRSTRSFRSASRSCSVSSAALSA